MNHIRNALAMLLFTLLFLAHSAGAQTVDLRLSTQLDCSSGQYLATLQIRASNATSFSIGTSSVFLNYDPTSLTFVAYQSLNFDGTTLCGGQSLWDTHSFDGSSPGLFNLTIVLNSSSISCPLITNTGWVDIGIITFNVRNSSGNPSLVFNPSFTSFNAVPANNGAVQIQQGQYTGVNQPGALQCIAPCSMSVTANASACNPATNTYAVTGIISATNTTANQSLTISTGTVNTILNLTGNGPLSYTLTGLPSDGLVKTVSVTSSATACGASSVTYTAPLSCSVACPAPVSVCQGSSYAIELSGPAGLGTYQWYRNGQSISGATTNSLTATQAGSYSLVINGDGSCVSGSCCPTVIVEVAGVPSFSAVGVSPTCSGTATQTNGQVSLSGLGNFTLGQYTYQYALGNSFDPITAQPLAAANVPAGGLILNNLAGGQTLTIRVFNALTGCYLDQTVLVPVSTCASCPPAVCLPIQVSRIK